MILSLLLGVPPQVILHNVGLSQRGWVSKLPGRTHCKRLQHLTTSLRLFEFIWIYQGIAQDKTKSEDAGSNEAERLRCVPIFFWPNTPLFAGLPWPWPAKVQRFWTLESHLQYHLAAFLVEYIKVPGATCSPEMGGSVGPISFPHRHLLLGSGRAGTADHLKWKQPRDLWEGHGSSRKR